MDNGYAYIPHREAKKFYGVSDTTLRRWASNGIVEFKRTKFNHRVYKIPITSSNQNRKEARILCFPKKFIYCRVSSSKQKDDLQRQCEFMQSKYPNHTIIKDIGSGLNYKRRGLLKLLELSNKGLVEELIISSKDRLCRFGFDLLEWLFLQNSTKLMVLDTIDKIPEQEFAEDILAVLQVFACRWNSKRRYTIAKDEKNQIKAELNPEKEI